MRRLATILLVAAGTATSVLYWLHDGDLEHAVAPVLPDWDAEQLASLAGIHEPTEAPAPPPALRGEGSGEPAGPPAAPEVTEPAEVERP